MKKEGTLKSFKLVKAERPDYYQVEIRLALEDGNTESFKVGVMTKEYISKLIQYEKIKIQADRKYYKVI